MQTRLKRLNEKILEKNFSSLLKYLFIKIYHHPLISSIVLAVLSNIYLIADYGVVNTSAVEMLWQLAHQNVNDIISQGIFPELINIVHNITGLDYIDSAYLLMIIAYLGITVLLLLLADYFNFSLLTKWALIFLLLAQPNLCNFRSYIIVEPLFWFLWLLAIYLLLKLYKQHTVLSIILWLIIFLCATRLNVAAWFWLLLFPFGALLWKPWRRMTVVYALVGYAITVGILLFLPIDNGISPIDWLQDAAIVGPKPLSDILRISDNNWIKEGDTLMFATFIFSGASSIVLIKVLFSLSIVCVFLLGYSLDKKQYRIINYDYLRIIIYAIIFDFLISVILMVLSADRSTILSFSMCLLLIVFSAQGLSYIFQKIYSNRYSRLEVLMIVWCMVAYFVSGFINFGARQNYIKDAGINFATSYKNMEIYSENKQFLFYANKNPANTLNISEAEKLLELKNFYYAYNNSSNSDIPTLFLKQKVVSRFFNNNGDEIIIFIMKKPTKELK